MTNDMLRIIRKFNELSKIMDQRNVCQVRALPPPEEGIRTTVRCHRSVHRGSKEKSWSHVASYI